MNARLTIVLTALLLLSMPAAVALGACRTGDSVERELERGHLVTLLDNAGNPSGCAVLVTNSATATRRYDPSTGRFTSRDPVEWPTGVPKMNEYQYAFNNPLRFTDPSGAWPGEGAASWMLDHTVESDAAYAYSNWVWNHDSVNSVFETVNKVNPAVGFLTNTDQCANGDWGPNGKPRTDAGMVAAGYEYGASGDGNHCWKAAAYGALTATAGLAGPEWAALRSTRLGYVQGARAIPTSGMSASEAVVARNALRQQVRGQTPNPYRWLLNRWRPPGAGPTYGGYVNAGKTDAQILAGAGNTNPWVNALFGIL